MNIDITQLDEADLLELNRRIVARLKSLQEAREYHQMLNFSIGDRVRFHPPGHEPKSGLVIKCNRKTVTVIADDHSQWNVAPVFLSRVIEGEPVDVARPGRVVPLPAKR